MEPFALKRALDNVRATTPLVHNITNYVTVNDCANALLAIGASPIMSDEPADVFDITSICGGLTLNIGTLNERSIQGMFAAGERASELGHPIVLDPVGAGASALRTRTASDLLDKLAVSVVRGNMSEAKALAGGAAATRGVDVCPGDAVTEDNLAAGAAVATANPDALLDATVAAVVGMGLAGQIAQGRMGGYDGNGSFRTYLLDALYNLDGDALEAGARVEELA